jgi:hypothetical protein
MNWKRITKIVLLGSMIVLIIVAGWSWRVQAQLKQRILAVRATGAPVSMADLQPSPVSPAENAATYLLRVMEDAARLVGELGSIVDRENFNWRMGLTDEQITAAEEAFAAYPNVLPALERAAECPTHAWPHDFNVPPDEFITRYIDAVSHWRTVARVLDCRARYLVSTGKHDEAAATYLRLLQLARLQAREPLLIGFLTNLALRSVAIEGLNNVLQTQSLTPETYTTIEKELAAHDSLESITHILETERAFGIESYRGLNGIVRLLGSDCIEYLDFMDHQIKIGDLSEFELVEAIPRPRNALASSVTPAIEAARNSMNRVRALSRCVRIVNALYADEVDDDFVELDSLGLSPSTLIDPFSGNQLLHERTTLGWKVGNRLVIEDGRTDVVITPPPSPEG